MSNTLSYVVKIRKDYRCFHPTVELYQSAVKMLILTANENWEDIKKIEGTKNRDGHMEKLVHGTSGRKARYDCFDKSFPKFPSYLRRSAIQTALGAVASHHVNLTEWEKSDRSGKKPRLNPDRNAMPCFYIG